MVAERRHHIEQFFEGDESASVSNFVIVNGISQLCNLWSR